MLVKRKVERDKSKYLSYEELKEYVRTNNILTKQQYISHVSKNYLVNGKNIPYNPSTFYLKDIWEGFSTRVVRRDGELFIYYNGS